MLEKDLPNGFFPVMLTPFKDNKEIDFEALEELTDFYINAGCDGLFANCLSSEMYELTENERLQVTKTVVDRVNGKIPVIASGTFGSDIAYNASFIQKLSDLGVHTSVIISNQLNPLETDEKFFESKVQELAERTGIIDLGLYECPVPFKRILSPSLLKSLAETGRFTYLKDTTCDLQEIKKKVAAIQGTRLKLYNANTPTALESMNFGAAGVSPIAGNFFPEFFSYLVKREDDENQVERLNTLITILDEITGNSFYPLSSKIFLKMRGLRIVPITRTTCPSPTNQDLIKLEAMWDSVVNISKALKIDLVKMSPTSLK